MGVSPPSRRYLLVGNPTARSGKAAARIERALQAMRDRGMQVDFLPTEPEGRTVSIVRDVVTEGRADTLIYLGGDGTFAEVAKGILEAPNPVPLGMLPSGTANDLGKSFGISSSEDALSDNLDVIEAGHTIALDAGRVDQLNDADAVVRSDVFFDSLGWGMNPDILQIRNEDREKVKSIPVLRDVYRDQAVYAGAALRAFVESWLSPADFDAEVEVDGETHRFEGLTDLVIKGVAIYGGEWVLDRYSEPDDGHMELVPMHGRAALLGQMIVSHRGLPVWADSTPIKGSDFAVRLFRGGDRPDVAAQIDGEEWGAGTRYHAIVIPGALELVVRADWEPPWKASG